METSIISDYMSILDDVLSEHVTYNQKLIIYLDVAKKMRDRQKDAEGTGYSRAVEEKGKNDPTIKYDF